MLRRLLAALLVAAVAMPVPALATPAPKPCPMAGHAAMGPGHRCCCNESAPAPSPGCDHATTTASTRGGCDCVVKADPGAQPAATANASSSTFAGQPFAHSTRLPAAMGMPRRQPRALHVDDPPPAPGVVLRARLCSWIL